MEATTRTGWAPAAAILALALCACLPREDLVRSERWQARALGQAERAIVADEILADITALASDELEGRAPGTRGEMRTLAWLAHALEQAGAQPGTPDGGWLQPVPLVGFTVKPYLRLRVGQQHMEPVAGEGFVAVTRQPGERLEVSGSSVVFAGYGVVAPEYGWDDFKDVDLRGKTVLVLVGDPPVPDPSDPARLDEALFRGRAMTYYGRWTYKYEVAGERGAAACVIVHQTGPAGYPWEVVATGRTRENFDLAGADREPGRVPIEAWVTEDVARRLLKACGEDLDELAARAASREFRPVELSSRADFRLDVERREIESHNLVARIPGRGPRADEWVVYSAHWDHLGLDPEIEGDGIYNGALDNATGTAALVALARAYSALPSPPSRSILLLAVTAEEKGLLGSRYYAEHPLYPLRSTLAAINMDGINPWGRTRDVVSVSQGQTTLEQILAVEAAQQARVVVPDPEPEKGYFYRSDHFEFAKRGVPALYAESGVDYVGRPAGWGLERRAQYTSQDYHKPSDEVGQDWDLSGLVEDVRLYLRVGLRVSEGQRAPQWLPGSEFRAAREASLADPDGR